MSAEDPELKCQLQRHDSVGFTASSCSNWRMRRNAKPVSLSRHRRNCSVCAHAQRAEIEADFIAWRSPAALATEYGFADRASMYRHAHAFGLFAKRQANVRAALERIIEQADAVQVTAAAVVSAMQAYSKIDSAGQWIEHTEELSFKDLFERMTRPELDAYAKDGALPAWFPVRRQQEQSDATH